MNSQLLSETHNSFETTIGIDIQNTPTVKFTEYSKNITYSLISLKKEYAQSDYLLVSLSLFSTILEENKTIQ